MARLFIPHPECTVLNGDCFAKGKCLSGCGAKAASRRELLARIEQLQARVRQLEARLRQTSATQEGD